MTVIVRTHGGLGNQLFQIFYARLLSGAAGTDYAERHDLNYEHHFARSDVVPSPPKRCTPVQRAISRTRLPKLLGRSGLSRGERITIGRDIYLDGYFQDAADYAGFGDPVIAAGVERFRSELSIARQSGDNPRTLYHIRLGDFFDDAQAALTHAQERVAALTPGSTVITNQEELFQSAPIRFAMEARNCRIIPSADLAAEDVLRLMATYGTIVTNDSTLALWASVLGNARTSFRLPRLAALHARLFAVANPAATAETIPISGSAGLL